MLRMTLICGEMPQLLQLLRRSERGNPVKFAVSNRIMKLSISLLLVATGLVLAGCNTFNARARQMSAVYDNLSASDQQRLQRGAINVGDTPEMVYIALGNPDERRDITNADGTQTTWIYRTYWQQYEGQAWLGYRRVIVPARGGRGYVVFHEPVTQDVYRTNVDDRIRVTFANGVVQSIEQQHRG